MKLQENIQRIKQMMGLLTENNEFYDKILDLYSEVGMEGMSEDEIAYLKSGGKSELPRRFESELQQQEYDDFMKNPSVEPDLSDIYEKTQKLREILDNSEWKISYPFDGLGLLGYLFQIIFKDEKLFGELVDVLYGSEEDFKNDKYDLKQVSFRGENEPLSQEYKIAITIPKSWYPYLFDE